MRLAHPWLLVVLPVVTALAAVGGVLLSRLGHSVDQLGRAAAIGAFFGLILAGALSLRRAARDRRRARAGHPTDE